MRRKAAGFADSIDSPQFSAQDRIEYRKYLKELGDSPSLTFALWMADMGLNPLVRKWKRFKRSARDHAKRLVRGLRSGAVRATAPEGL
jgi:hypothetical protein